jgi:hypothetical protein
MNELLRFLERLFTEGTVRVRQRPELVPADRPRVERILRDAYAEYILTVAGAAPPFDAALAVRAAEVLADACWFLLSRAEPPDEVTQRLTLEPTQPTAGQLLSADLCLHYLPEVYRRARGIDAGDTLTLALAQLLRRWPLAGVLAGLTAGPLGDLQFADHAGLQLLYAERLSLAPDPAWLPPEGPARQWVELVFDRKGLPMPKQMMNDER